MVITLYSFSKKRNSTHRPSSGGYDVEVKLKENCSIYNPTFILNHNAGDFNYVKVSAQQGEQYWKSTKDLYYWVDDITFLTDRIISAQCSIDPYASAKEDILSTRANVMYCADSTRDSIPDHRLPITNYVNYEQNVIDLSVENSGGLQIVDLSYGFSGEPSIILGVTGKGSFGTYLLHDFYDLPEILDGCDNYMSGIFTDMLTGLKQIFYGGTASECLKSAIALPIVLTGSTVGDPNGRQLFLGNYPCTDNSLNPILVHKIRSQILKGTYRLYIPWASDAPHGSWLRSAPYNRFFLYFPFIGMLELNASDMANDLCIDIEYAVNITSGDISIMIKGIHEEEFDQKKRILATANGNMAINTPFGSTGIDTNRLTQAVGTGISSLAASAAMFATGNAIGGAMTLTGGIASAAGNTIAAAGGTGYGDGGLGGGSSSGLDKHIRLIAVQHSLTETPARWAATYGKPYFMVDTIGNHSGLVITEGASVSSDLSAALIDTINAGLDGGLYIE